MAVRIPFHRPARAPGVERAALAALQGGPGAGGGVETRRCQAAIETAVGARAFLTTSCTDALELAMLVLRLQPGDEVVMPSWTYPSTANAVALRGAVPVLVDVEPRSLNLDPARVEAALSPRTRALIAVHYAGVGCDLDALAAVCAARGIALIEDAAQAYGAAWRGRPLGAFGRLAAFSFHASKNIGCGEGGALVVGAADVAAAEVAWEKGTDQAAFMRGEIPGFQWVGLGSSFLPSELTAAVLAAQLEGAAEITRTRRAAWDRYADLCADARLPSVRRPDPPAEAEHNGHIFHLRFRDAAQRDGVRAHLRARGIDARPHYMPLHSAPAAARLARQAGACPVTEAAARTLLRLPLDGAISAAEQAEVVAAVGEALRD